MALIHRDARCAICDGPFSAGEPMFASSGTWVPRDHPLFRYCDAPMH